MGCTILAWFPAGTSATSERPLTPERSEAHHQGENYHPLEVNPLLWDATVQITIPAL